MMTMMQTASSDVLTIGTLLQVIGAVLLTVLSYIGMEIRRDVRDMKQKVTILWDRSQRATEESWDGAERRERQ